MKVACGSEHTLIVSNNQVYSFGWNEHGNLGVGNTVNSGIPVLCFQSDHIYSVSCGYGNSFIVSE